MLSIDQLIEIATALQGRRLLRVVAVEGCFTDNRNPGNEQVLDPAIPHRVPVIGLTDKGVNQPTVRFELKNKVNPELVAGGGRFKDMSELVQADMRKQNQLGWYVHQVVTSGNGWFSNWMVIYRRDEEM